jgi:hypothetical protein
MPRGKEKRWNLGKGRKIFFEVFDSVENNYWSGSWRFFCNYISCVERLGWKEREKRGKEKGERLKERENERERKVKEKGDMERVRGRERHKESER